jgi:hypothetical protein
VKVYTHKAYSPSDPEHGHPGLEFESEDLAQNHADELNRHLDDYDAGSWWWNKKYWKSKPLPWVVDVLREPRVIV